MKNVMIIGIFFLSLFFSGPGWTADFLVVFAGAGLRIPLDEIGSQFEREYGIRVNYDYEGSGRLGAKILAGQTPDVFIPGGAQWARMLQEKGFVNQFWGIALHVPVIIRPLKNDKVSGLEEFMRSDVRLVLGDANACAIGRIDNLIFKKSGLDESRMNVIAKAVTVNQVLHWIESRNADAGIVWRSVAMSSDRVEIVPIPEKGNAIDAIPVCEMADTDKAEMAGRYIDFLLNKGKAVFHKYGYIIQK